MHASIFHHTVNTTRKCTCRTKSSHSQQSMWYKHNMPGCQHQYAYRSSGRSCHQPYCCQPIVAHDVATTTDQVLLLEVPTKTTCELSGLTQIQEEPVINEIEINTESSWYVEGTDPRERGLDDHQPNDIADLYAHGGIAVVTETSTNKFWCPQVILPLQEDMPTEATEALPAALAAAATNEDDTTSGVPEEVHGTENPDEDSQSQSLLPSKTCRQRLALPTKRYLGVATQRHMIPEAYGAPGMPDEDVTDEGSEGQATATKQPRRKTRCSRKPKN